MIDVATAAITSRSWAGSGHLSLRNLGLRTVPDLFDGAPDLRSVDLSGNRLRELPASLYTLTGLERLDLANNRLRTVAPQVGRLTALRVLDLSENRLTDLPPELASCAGLEDLQLYGNALVDIGPVAALPHLVALDLARNRLRELPPLAATALRSLDLSGNAIEAVPGHLAGLPALRRLDLSGNRVDAPGHLARLPLEELYLDGNQLAEAPTELASKPGLRRLSVRGNPFGSMPGDGGLAEAVGRHVTGGHEPGRQYFDAPTYIFGFFLAVGGFAGVGTVVDLYYKRFRGVSAVLRFADGSRVELANLSRRTALDLVRDHREAVDEADTLVGLEPTRAESTRRAAEEFVVQAVSRLDAAKLLPTAADGQVIQFTQYNITGGAVMGDQINIGNITNSNVNIKSTLQHTRQRIDQSNSLDDSRRAELATLIEQLAAALESVPPAQSEDAEAVAEAADDLVAKATRDNPNRRSVEISANGLLEAVAGIVAAVPIVGEIVASITALVTG